MTPEQEKQILQLVQLGAYPAQAAKQVGFTPQAITMRCKRKPEFARKVEEAEAKAQFGFISVIVRAAQQEGDWRAAVKYLQIRWPELYADPEVRVQMATASVNTQDLVKAIHAGMKAIAARHCPSDEPDVDAEPATKDEGGVTRS